MRRQRERGQAIIEMALIIPVTVLLFVGTWTAATLIGANDTAAQVTGYGAQIAASIGNDGYGTGSFTESSCQSSDTDPCAVDQAVLAAVVPTLATQLPESKVLEIDIYQPDHAGSCLAVDGVLPGECPVSDGELVSGDRDDCYTCSSNCSSSTSWTLQTTPTTSGLCKDAGTLYTLDQRTQVHPDEQAIGVSVIFRYVSPGLPYYTQDDTQYTALSFPPEAD